MTVWTEVEHLPTRKRMVRFDGTNGFDIERLVDDTDLCRWDGYELIVRGEQGPDAESGWFKVSPDDRILVEVDGSAAYPIPPARYAQQYRVVRRRRWWPR